MSGSWAGLGREKECLCTRDSDERHRRNSSALSMPGQGFFSRTPVLGTVQWLGVVTRGSRAFTCLKAPRGSWNLLAHPGQGAVLGCRGLGNGDLRYEMGWIENSPSRLQPPSSGHRVGEEA